MKRNSYRKMMFPRLTQPFPTEVSINVLPLSKKQSRLQELKLEEKLLKVLDDQTSKLEKVLTKFKEKDEKKNAVFDKQMEKFLSKSEKIKRKKFDYEYINEKIERSCLFL